MNKANLKDFFATDIKVGGVMAPKAKVRLYQELRLLLSAGLDVKSAIELLRDESTGSERELLDQLDRELIKGKSLSAALNGFSGFSNYEVFSIRIGEEAGDLGAVFEQLELYYTRVMQLRRQLTSALSYPLFVLLVSFGVVYFMLNYIVPMFEDVFRRFGGELPALTKTMLGLSVFVRAYGWIFIVLPATICFYLYLNRKKNEVRSMLARIALRLPLIGETVRKIYLARFCQVMYLLTSARVPLTEAISLVEQMIGFYPMELSMPGIRKQLTNGSSLHKALAQHAIYEKRLVALIKVAEEVNQLDSMFNQLAKQYNEDIDHRTQVLGKLLEPIMILLIASVVGIILVAMYLPLFKLSTTIS